MELDEEDFLGEFFLKIEKFVLIFFTFSDTDCDDQNADQYQSRNLYADLLPHSEFIPEEADKWWAWIKMNLPRCVEAMEIRPGLLQVDRYLRVYISLHRNGFISVTRRKVRRTDARTLHTWTLHTGRYIPDVTYLGGILGGSVGNET